MELKFKETLTTTELNALIEVARSNPNELATLFPILPKSIVNQIVAELLSLNARQENERTSVDFRAFTQSNNDPINPKSLDSLCSNLLSNMDTLSCNLLGLASSHSQNKSTCEKQCENLENIIKSLILPPIGQIFVEDNDLVEQRLFKDLLNIPLEKSLKRRNPLLIKGLLLDSISLNYSQDGNSNEIGGVVELCCSLISYLLNFVNLYSCVNMNEWITIFTSTISDLFLNSPNKNLCSSCLTNSILKVSVDNGENITSKPEIAHQTLNYKDEEKLEKHESTLNAPEGTEIGDPENAPDVSTMKTNVVETLPSTTTPSPPLAPLEIRSSLASDVPRSKRKQESNKQILHLSPSRAFINPINKTPKSKISRSSSLLPPTIATLESPRLQSSDSKYVSIRLPFSADQHCCTSNNKLRLNDCLLNNSANCKITNDASITCNNIMQLNCDSFTCQDYSTSNLYLSPPPLESILHNQRVIFSAIAQSSLSPTTFSNPCDQAVKSSNLFKSNENNSGLLKEKAPIISPVPNSALKIVKSNPPASISLSKYQYQEEIDQTCTNNDHSSKTIRGESAAFTCRSVACMNTADDVKPEQSFKEVIKIGTSKVFNVYSNSHTSHSQLVEDRHLCTNTPSSPTLNRIGYLTSNTKNVNFLAHMHNDPWTNNYYHSQNVAKFNRMNSNRQQQQISPKMFKNRPLPPAVAVRRKKMIQSNESSLSIFSGR